MTGGKVIRFRRYKLDSSKVFERQPSQQQCGSVKVEGLDLSRVFEDSPRTLGDYKTAVRIMGVILYHNSLPKDEKGVATATIRILLTKFAPSCTGMLRDYVCAFGAHGLAVLKRYLVREYGKDKADFDASIEFDAQQECDRIANELQGIDLSTL